MYCKASGAKEIQGMTAGVSGEVDVLCEVVAMQQNQEFNSSFTVCVVDMEIKITKEDSRR